MQTTTLNRPWLVKMAIFLVILLGFGVYGLYDATVAYPRRGERYAETRLYEYLKASQQSGPLTSRVSVENPREDLARLKTMERSLSDPEKRRKEWLESLEVIGRLSPDATRLPEPDRRYAELQKQWATGGQPKPLEWYDIPVQWLFVLIGIGGALWLAGLFLAVARKRYRWDPEAPALHLPGGQVITPADLEDVDKRRWDKFLVYLRLKPAHPTLGGRELKLDLYRYAPLESWVLELERAAFPGREQESPPGADPSPPQIPGETGPGEG
jgi:hypothetical protein